MRILLVFVRQQMKMKIKKTLTIPEWLNEKAIAMGLNFSQILQEALLERVLKK